MGRRGAMLAVVGRVGVAARLTAATRLVSRPCPVSVTHLALGLSLLGFQGRSGPEDFGANGGANLRVVRAKLTYRSR